MCDFADSDRSLTHSGLAVKSAFACYCYVGILYFIFKPNQLIYKTKAVFQRSVEIGDKGKAKSACRTATAVEVGAANLIDPFACKSIIEDLPRVMEKYRIDSLSEIIGAVE